MVEQGEIVLGARGIALDVELHSLGARGLVLGAERLF